MSKYKVLFLDVDGTILKPDHSIENSTKEAIMLAKEKGIEVFLATGRPLHELSDIAKALDVHSFIGYNGAYAVYQDEVVYNKPLKSGTIEHFLHIAQKKGHEMVLYSSNKNYFTSMESPIVQTFIDFFKLKKNDLYTDSVKNEILGVTLMGVKEEEVASYRAEENLHFSPVNIKGLDNYYDVIRDSVNKGVSVSTVLQLMNLPKQSAIAFGDGLNDKEMLQSVGAGIAMGNAHPQLFDYAMTSTTTVSDSGIYRGLVKLGVIDQ